MSGMRNTVTIVILRGRRRREVDILGLASSPDCAVRVAQRAVALDQLLREEVISASAVEDETVRPLPRKKRRQPVGYLAKVLAPAPEEA
jgi:hypothetical protein